MTDYDDYTVMKNDKDRWDYAKKVDGVLVSSGVDKVIQPNLASFPIYKQILNFALWMTWFVYMETGGIDESDED